MIKQLHLKHPVGRLCMLTSGSFIIHIYDKIKDQNQFLKVNSCSKNCDYKCKRKIPASNES